MDDVRAPWVDEIQRRVRGEPFLSRFARGIARALEGATPAESLKLIREEMRRIFACREVSLFLYDPEQVPGPEDGAWSLTVVSGLGEGNRVCQSHALGNPELEPGHVLPFSEELATAAALKAVALAFERDGYFGADIGPDGVTLLEDPRPDDELGSGDLSVLAIPLTFHTRSGALTEQARVGVLAMFRTPNSEALEDLEQGLRSLLARAVVTPGCLLRDPVTRLHSEGFLREELERTLALRELTGSGLQGGLVVGMIDTLRVYRETLARLTGAPDEAAARQVSDALRRVAGCLSRQARAWPLAGGATYRAGLAGRIGFEGFGVVLPGLDDGALLAWARELAASVVALPFVGEEALAGGQLTVGLRVLPFQEGAGPGGAERLWRAGCDALAALEQEQSTRIGAPEALARSCGTLAQLRRGAWVSA